MPDEEYTADVRVRMTPAMKQQLEEEARRLDMRGGKGKSHVVRKAIELYFQQTAKTAKKSEK